MRLVPIFVFGLIAFGALAVHAEEEGEAAAAVTPAVIGDCTPPEAPTIPDGATAPASEIKAANEEVKDFVAAGEDYTTCLDDYRDALGDDMEDEQETAIIEAHNAMVDQMTGVADGFNAAVAAYKAKRAEANADAASE